MTGRGGTMIIFKISFTQPLYTKEQSPSVPTPELPRNDTTAGCLKTANRMIFRRQMLISGPRENRLSP